MAARRTRTPSADWPQAVAALAGVLFVVMGIVGFGATGFGGFADNDTPDRLFGMSVNPLQNLVHLGFGVAGIVLSARPRRTRVFGWVLAAGLGGLFGYGLLAMRYPDIDVLNLGWAANWVHLAFAVLGLVIATGPVRTRERAPV